MNKTAALATSDIQRFVKGSDDSLESTGLLERCQKSGYKVLVASTRTKLMPTDDWWVALVGRENVFLAQGYSPAVYDPFDYGERNIAVSYGWMQLFDKLEIPWPTRACGEREFWTTATHTLSWHGVKTGYELRKEEHDD